MGNDKKELNTLHAQTSFIPIHTPPDVRIGLTLMPARYLLRGSVRTLTDSLTPAWMRRYTSTPIVDMNVKPFFRKIDAALAKADVNAIFKGPVPRNVDDILDAVNGSEEGKKLLDNLDEILKEWGANSFRDNTVQYAFREGIEKKGIPSLTSKSKSRLQSNINNRLFEMYYDYGLGVGSLYMSYQLTKRAMNDMRGIYTEAVAYETGKDPKDVTFMDILNSDNQIIQSTTKVFRRKQFQRYGASALFFLRSPFKWLQAGEMAIGAWGLNWMFDIWGRQPTMLESFTYFVNDKLNPMYGIGDPISKGDVINLYQQYTKKFRPEIAFKSVLHPDLDEGRVWANGERIFNRIADLMNNTYNYKHKTELDENDYPIPLADFTLPKFIYLLGHGLINPREQEWTMTFIEIANHKDFGIEAVKEVEKAKAEGALPKDVLEIYPVNIYPYRNKEGNTNKHQPANTPSRSNFKQTASDPSMMTGAPNHVISASGLNEERIHASHEQHIHDLSGI